MVRSHQRDQDGHGRRIDRPGQRPYLHGWLYQPGSMQCEDREDQPERHIRDKRCQHDSDEYRLRVPDDRKNAFSPGDSGGPVETTIGSGQATARGEILAYVVGSEYCGWYMPERYIESDWGATAIH